MFIATPIQDGGLGSLLQMFVSLLCTLSAGSGCPTPI